MFFEGSKFEERIGNLSDALDICKKGLYYKDNYPPLWFHYLRLLDKTNSSDSDINQCVNEACDSISYELLWKLYVDVAEIFAK